MKTPIPEIFIKAVLAILLLVCLFRMPYGYYQLVRFLAMVGFGILGYYAIEQKKQTEVIIYIALVILFQPLWKIPLGRTLWNIIDVIVALGILSSFFKKKEY